MTAPLPVTVAAAGVAEVDTFRRRDVLIVLEAMNVEIAIRDEGAGAARTITVQPDDRVEEGVMLMTVAVPPPDPVPAGSQDSFRANVPEFIRPARWWPSTLARPLRRTTFLSFRIR